MAEAMTFRSAIRAVLVVAGVALLVGGLVWSPHGTAQVDELGRLALALTIVVTAALAGGHVAGRFGQAAVLGELLAGILLGSIAGAARVQFIGVDPYLDIVARIGMLSARPRCSSLHRRPPRICFSAPR